MSGGVDSSVTARLLAEQDYDLSAVFMRNWDTRDESATDSGCEWKKDWEDVQRVCKMLDIPCKLIDLSREYWTRVFEPCLRLWEKGETPNPDIWCNREVKFGALFDRITSEDTWLATGHYADKAWSTQTTSRSSIPTSATFPRPQLARPLDRNKDQTYYLAAITEASLARTLFPLARLKKPEVRDLARQWGLPTAQREESMGVCFVGEKKRFDQFIAQYIPPCQGQIVDHITGKVLGTHQGLWSFTIGQNARIPGMPERMCVARKDPSKNEVRVVPGSDHPALYVKSIVAEEWSWIWADSPPAEIRDESGFGARVQFRHRMLDVPCTVRQGTDDRSVVITFDEPQKAVAAGQIAVVWDDAICLGCGIITEAGDGVAASDAMARR
ncbi:tRNA 5-methylaminomethyl-2-thiouridylate-methyltransferase [Obba rivulosa]|uniref:tRNA-5-taurinomethyluridine 2-sulfurtransferase n=1 Tax=Obba rivulosa TaxID=1052685 RepID=A0A8E2DQ99_9APHY|nr:tRNA 5-methylaminomethyl-2-thiouridylate-methyltransferase [Obba rivulosa]